MNQFNASMMFLGMALVAVALVWIALDRKKSGKELKKLEEKKDELVGIINDAEQMIEEMNRFSDYIVTQMDLKNTELASTLKKLEAKAGKISQALSVDEIKAAASSPIQNQAEKLVKQQEKVSLPPSDLIIETLEQESISSTPAAPKQPKQRDKVIPLAGRHTEILRLRDKGYNETEIARNLNLGKGEIQLVLELNKQKAK